MRVIKKIFLNPVRLFLHWSQSVSQSPVLRVHQCLILWVHLSPSVPVSATSVLQDSMREEEEISQPLVVNTVTVQDLRSNTEYLEREETVKVARFINDGCDYDLAHRNSCTTLFTVESLEGSRRECFDLTRVELDMTLFGQLVAFTSCSSLTSHSSRHWLPSVSHQRSYSVFWHGDM